MKELTDIAPKAVAAAVVSWAVLNYAIVAPEVASRVTRADYLPMCEADFRTITAKAAQDRAAAVPVPMVDQAREMAAARLRAMQNNPMMDQLRRMSGGMGDLFGLSEGTDMALRQYEQNKEAAAQAYQQAIERIKQETATELGKAGDVCGCVADAAIAETRTEWAIFSGTLGLIRPAPIKAFDERMAQVHRTGRCTAGTGR